MSDDVFEWEESDEKYTKYESTNEVSLSDIMYGFECFECGEEVWNTDFYPDPDSPCWSYECHECDLHYTVRPTKVRASAADANQ